MVYWWIFGQLVCLLLSKKTGICVYEFMCGLVPFGEDCDDPYEVYQMISQHPLQYPVYFITKTNRLAKKLIEQLLNREPDARLGGSYAALKAHGWFDMMDWVFF